MIFLTFNSDIFKFILRSETGECLAIVPNEKTAEELKKMYEEMENDYYNSVDYQDDTPWFGYRYL